MKVNCAVCGTLFFTRECRIKDGRGKYCSVRCRGLNRRKQKVELICQRCGESKFLTPGDYRRNVKYGGGKFCSRKCASVHHSENPVDPVIRFWQQIEKLPGENGCWIWIGSRDLRQYGKFSLTKGGKQENFRAHRYSYELAYGAIDPTINVLHKCDNPPCVRPDHLFLGSHADNIADKVRKDRHAKGSRIGTSKLTEEQVKQIRESLRRGTHWKQLATEFNVHYCTIHAIKYWKRWKHVL